MSPPVSPRDAAPTDLAHRDTVTVTETVGGGQCLLTVWDREGHPAMEVRCPCEHATPDMLRRILAYVRNWQAGTPLEPGPRLVD